MICLYPISHFLGKPNLVWLGQLAGTPVIKEESRGSYQTDEDSFDTGIWIGDLWQGQVLYQISNDPLVDPYCHMLQSCALICW